VQQLKFWGKKDKKEKTETSNPEDLCKDYQLCQCHVKERNKIKGKK